MTSERDDKVWLSSGIVNQYLNGVSAAIPFKKEQLEVMVRMAEAAFGKQTDALRFLDLGCGDGILGATLLGRFPRSHGVMADFSEPMLQAARGQLKSFASQLAFIQADYADPAWVSLVSPYAPFDAIVSGFSIHHQPDERKRNLYGELYNLLAPGGLFVNLEHVASRTAWGEKLFDALFIDSLVSFHSRKGSGRTRDEIANEYYYREDRKANILTSVDVQCDWLREIGFTDVDCYFRIFELAVFGGMKQR
ncbi:MAG TPA: class I SAM-dependent methyltransferase [Anaerolineae bacterium]|jgi:ubiquinone/menaquinone biosynthesis C-methylase UbiE